MHEQGWNPVRGSAPAVTHTADPARRQIGESYKDYADRIYGMYRAVLADQGRALTAEAMRAAPSDAAAVHQAQTFAINARATS